MIDSMPFQDVSLADVLSERPTPPIDAILAECLQPHLYRRWLVQQTDVSHEERTVVGLYMEHIGLTKDRVGAHPTRIKAPAWLSRTGDRDHLTYVRQRNHITVADALANLDAVLAELGITWKGYPSE